MDWQSRTVQTADSWRLHCYYCYSFNLYIPIVKHYYVANTD